MSGFLGLDFEAITIEAYLPVSYWCIEKLSYF